VFDGRCLTPGTPRDGPVGGASCGIVRAVIGPGSQPPAADPTTRSATSSTSAVVWLVGLTALVAQTAARAWAVYPGWFAADDYTLLLQTRARPLTWELLVGTTDDPMLPFGRLMGWLVAHQEPLSWTTAAHVSVALQALAGLACLWMLTTMFGPRPGILVPFLLYLTSAAGLPASLWWSAAVTELPGQIALFLGVAAWVRFLRSGRWIWAILTAFVLLGGLASWPAAPLIPVVLLGITAVYAGWSREGARRRPLVGWVAAATGAGALVVGMVVAGRTWLGTPPLEQSGWGPWWSAARVLVTGVPVTVLGGPGGWSIAAPPILEDQRSVALAVAAGVLAGVAVVISLMVRRRAGLVWLLLAAYLAGLAVLRPTLGDGLPGDTDYLLLAAALPIVTVVLGLVAFPVLGARGATRVRDHARPWARPTAVVAIGLAGLAVVGGVWSSATLVRDWRAADVGHRFVDTVRLSLAAQAGPPDLVDTPLPPEVVPPGVLPTESVSALLRLLDADGQFPDHSDDLQILDSEGRVRPVQIEAEARARTGPAVDCGWLVRHLVTIPLDADTTDGPQWVRLGYLAPDESPLRIAAGPTVVDAHVRKGLHSLWVRADGPFRSVSVSGLDPGVAVCVDVVEAGTALPQEPS